MATVMSGSYWQNLRTLISFWERRHGWYGQVEHSSGAVRTICVQVDGRWEPGRPKLTWKKLWKLSAVDKKGTPGDQASRLQNLSSFSNSK